MVWEHSYVPEAYHDVRIVLETWPAEDIAQALADYNYETFHGEPGYCGRKGKPHRKGAWDYRKLLHLPHDVLVDACMDCVRTVRLCSNDFHEMYIDWDGWHAVRLPE